MPTPAAAAELLLELQGQGPRFGCIAVSRLLLLAAVLLLLALLVLVLLMPSLAGCKQRPYAAMENAGLLEMHGDWQLMLLARGLRVRHCILSAHGLQMLELQRCSNTSSKTSNH